MARPRDQTLRPLLLQAATLAFARQGFQAASMTAIGAHAGVTKGGVYFHFPSKEVLFFAVLDHWNQELERALGGGPTERRAPLQPALVDLEHLLRRWLDFHFRYPDAARLLNVLGAELAVGFAAAAREDLARRQSRLRARLREWLQEAMAEGSPTVADPAQDAFLLAAALEGVLHQWLANPREAGPYCDADRIALELVHRFAGATPPAVSEARRSDPLAEGYRPAF